MKIVLDTNVLVSAVRSAGGPPARVVELLVVGSLHAAYDSRILAEYRAVLLRDKFGFAAVEVEALLRQIEAAGRPVDAAGISVPCKLPDPSDLPFVQVAICAEVDAIVTGNRRHFPETCGVLVLSPAELVALIDDGHGSDASGDEPPQSPEPA